MERSIKVFLKTIILCFIPIAIFCQDVQLKAYVSKNAVTSEEHFTYSVEVSGSSTDLPDINLPPLTNFFILSGPSQSTNIQFINGKSSATKTFTYYLKARKNGTLKIGKATAEIDGQTIESNEITITVSKASATPQKKGKQNNTGSLISNKDIFLKSNVSKRNVYLGEQVIIEYKLYFKSQVRRYEYEQDPAATGFWKEDFELPSQPQIENEVVNGVNYSVATLKKVAVFPNHAGTLEIEPMVISVEAIIPTRRRRQSLFDSFFNSSGQTVKKTVSSGPIKLNVKNLPEKGKPRNFDGAVGSFNFSATLDKNTAEVNEAVALKIQLAGSGNIKLAKLPLADIPTDIEQYEPKFNSGISKKNNRISGSKTAEYILIPRLPGEFKIKPISFSYFDPKSKKYVSKSSGPLTLKITGDAAVGSTPMAGFSRKEVTLLGRDIRFIKENTVLRNISEQRYFSGYLLSGFILGIICFVGFLFYDDNQAKIAGDKVLARSRAASKLAGKLLAEAKSYLNSDDFSAFYKAVNLALSRFVQDKLNMDLADFNAQTAVEALSKKQMPEELISDYSNLVQDCDFKQFAGASSSSEDKKETLEKARIVITKMEKYI